MAGVSKPWANNRSVKRPRPMPPRTSKKKKTEPQICIAYIVTIAYFSFHLPLKLETERSLEYESIS